LLGCGLAAIGFGSNATALLVGSLVCVWSIVLCSSWLVQEPCTVLRRSSLAFLVAEGWPFFPLTEKGQTRQLKAISSNLNHQLAQSFLFKNVLVSCNFVWCQLSSDKSSRKAVDGPLEIL
jgi:hypothetical protein